MSHQPTSELCINLLGPMQATLDGLEQELGGPKPRLLLAMLVAAHDQNVTTESLIDGVWGDDPPRSAKKSVQVSISNLRRVLGDSPPIATTPSGYRFESENVDVDTIEFTRLLEAATGRRRSDPRSALDDVRAALALWRGRAFDDLAREPGLLGPAAELEQLRLNAVQLRIDLDLDAGRHTEILGEVESLIAEHPYVERFRAQQMLALYRAGRQADALRSFQRARDELVAELGIDPSRELVELEGLILSQAAELEVHRSTSGEELAFFVTDIVDSTSQWESDPAAMSAALELHDELLTSSVEAHEGRVFKHTGDGILAVFPTLRAAADAAVAAQTRLLAADWPTTQPVEVRAAIDSGPVDGRGDDYFGPVLNRVMRIMSSGHGGQLLVRAEAVGLLDAPCRSLGPAEYKGIGRIDVAQIVEGPLDRTHPELRTEKSPPAIPRPGFSQAIRGYELREKLGAGEFGEVYRSYQPSVGREVAVKVIRRELANQPLFVKRFEAEAQFVAQLEHPHIVSLYDYWRDPDGAYLVMRYLRGGSLAASLDRGTLHHPAMLRLIEQVGQALGYAHRQGVIHGDVKPANVLLDADGNAYLSDFGIAARPTGHEQIDRSSAVYVAPEQLLGLAADARSDLYCLGLLAHEALTGVRPPLGEQPDMSLDRSGDIPVEVADAVARATAPDPDDRFDQVEDFLRALRQASGTDVVTTSPLRSATRPVRNPYKGLRAFGETDADDFFGRDELVGDLLTALRTCNLVSAVGPSGSGKSSAVKAGVIPTVRAGALGGDWVVSEMFPGSYPFEELEASLLRVATERPADILSDLLLDDRGLLRTSKQVLPDDETSLLLIIDQFEELFSLVDDEATRTTFLEALTAVAADERSRIKIVITMRADFFDRPLAYPAFADALSAGLVPVAMPSSEELAQAVALPARSAGLEFDDGVVARIVAEVGGEPGGLPLLQYALTELVERGDGPLLTMSGYDDTGGVLGALGRRAEEIYDGLTPSARTAAKELFLRLVTVAENGDDTRRRARRTELAATASDPSSIDTAIDAFGAFRLLSFDHDPITRGPTVEVAHEALLRRWGRLRGWVDDRREDLVLHRRLEQSARDWQQDGRDPSHLARQARLQQFERLSEGVLRLTPLERDFLEESRRAESAEDEQRRRRRQRSVAALAVFSVVAVLLAGLALVQRNAARSAQDDAEREAAASAAAAERADAFADEADRRAAAARARQLVTLSSSGVIDDSNLQAAVILEAVAVAQVGEADVPEVRGGLMQALLDDRIVRRLQNPKTPPEGRRLVLGSAGIFAVAPDGTRGMWNLPELAPGLPLSIGAEIVDLDSGSVLGAITDPAGFGWMSWEDDHIFGLTPDGRMLWYDPDTFDLTRTLQVPLSTGAIMASPRGDLVGYADIADLENLDFQTSVIDTSTEEVIFTGPDDVFFGHLSETGRYLAVPDEARFIRIFDIDTGEQTLTVDTEGTSIFETMSWSTRRDELIVAPFGGGLLRIDPIDGVVERRDHPATNFVSISPDGSLVVTLGPDGVATMLSGDDLSVITTLTGSPNGDQSLITWSADSRTMVISDGSGESLVWSLGEGHVAAAPELAVYPEPVDRVSALTGDRLLISASTDATEVRTARGELLQRFEHDDTGAAVASGDGRRFAVSSGVGRVAVVDSDTLELLNELDAVTPLAFSPDLGRLATGSVADGGTESPSVGYAVLDVATGAQVFSSQLRPDRSTVSGAAAFDRAGEVVAIGRSDLPVGPGTDGFSTGLNPLLAEHSFVLHDAETGEILVSITTSNTVSDLAFSRDGVHLVVLTDGQIHVHEVAALLDGVSNPLTSAASDATTLALDPDGSTILEGGPEGLRARGLTTLQQQWAVSTDGPVAAVTTDDTRVWLSVGERLPLEDQGFVVVSFPLDTDALTAAVSASIDRPVTDVECRQALGLPDCASRLTSATAGEQSEPDQ